MQLSLVAFYGAKPADLGALVARCQRDIAEVLGERFEPYHLEQVHATLLGLEREALPRHPFANRNEWRYAQRAADMQFDELLRALRERLLPITVRFGGFARGAAPFLSRGQTPYERGFTLQGDKVVLMGWPDAELNDDALNALRQTGLTYNVRHTWLQKPGDTDNDCFLRLGLVRPGAPVNEREKHALELRCRDRLAAMAPLRVEVSPDDVSIIAYNDERLPRASSRLWKLTDSRVDGPFLQALYSN